MREKKDKRNNDSFQVVQVRVTTRASGNHIKKVENADGSMLIKAYVTAVAEGGKANEAVIGLLAKELNVPKSALTIVQGHTSRNKLLRIDK